MKDLLREGAGLVSRFIRKGLCTVRDMAEKWKEYDRASEESLPTFLKNKQPTQIPDTAEPTVTILEGSLGQYRQGQRLALSGANKLVYEQALQYGGSGKAPPALRVRFDYIAEGRPDSYILPVKLEEKGDLLDHMQAWVDNCRADTRFVMQLFDNAPAQHQDKLRELLAPVLRDSLNTLSANLVQHFRRHCEISALEQQMYGQAQAMPKRAQRAFYTTTQESIAALRQAANTELLALYGRPAPVQDNSGKEPQNPVPVRENRTQQPRQSVRAQLRQNHAKQGARAVPRKARTVPQR